MAEGVGFEPTVELPLLLISSQVPLTTQPPFQPPVLLRNHWLSISFCVETIMRELECAAS